jgi:Ca-activated chloride channel family protein
MSNPFLAAGLVLGLVGCSPLVDPAATSATERELRFESGLSHPLVLAGEAQDVYLHVAVRAPELPPTPRPPLNLALVIDRSGSMASQDKLVHAKSAAEQLVGRLGREDRVALVSYDEHVKLELPSTSAEDTRPVLAAIRALATGGSTNLCGGLLEGVAELRRHLVPEHFNVVVLLSDGLANAGVTDPLEIARHAQRARGGGAHHDHG